MIPDSMSAHGNNLYAKRVRLTCVIRMGLWLGLLLLLPGMVRAQSYAISWFSIDAGGGTSTGGVYAVSGTIGQPDAGVHNGSPYVLQGGFWAALVAIQTPGAPFLSVTNANGQVVIAWALPAPGFVLEQVSVLGPAALWTQVPTPYQTNGTQVSITVPLPVGNRFYRLHKP